MMTRVSSEGEDMVRLRDRNECPLWAGAEAVNRKG
jgi:hypothetical protein